ncbi:MAG: hypothetical protein MUO78_09180 [candidate division Zixibacteria bacterium]|nr:hypothetical protein [candidate division Zixibacteria bacterium]
MFELHYEYEICLPTKYNDGSKIAASKFYKTKSELVKRFNGCSFFPAKGLWKYHDITLNEDNIILKTTANIEDDEFWEEYVVTLRERFKQVEINIHKIPIFIHKFQKPSQLKSKESSGESIQ